MRARDTIPQTTTDTIEEIKSKIPCPTLLLHKATIARIRSLQRR
jgi:hypothetical protein